MNIPCFVGRRYEMRTIAKTLAQGRNLVVTGKYGSGRTRLLRQAARTVCCRRPFFFTDFSRPPAAVCSQLLKQLQPTREAAAKPVRRSHKIARRMLLEMKLAYDRPPVIVLDNVETVTPQRLAFLQELVFAGRFRLVAIAESFLSAEDLFALRAALGAGALLKLQNLKHAQAVECFRRFAAEHALDWDEARILQLAAASGGYPLRITETLQKACEGQKHPCSQRRRGTV